MSTVELVDSAAAPSPEVARKLRDKLKRQREEQRKQRRANGEWSATVVGSILGCICLLLFNQQPVSATGALFQEIIHWRPETCIAGDQLCQVRPMTIMRFFIMILTMVVGTQAGHYGALFLFKKDRLLVVAVPTLVAIGLGMTVYSCILLKDNRNALLDTVNISVFALAIGLIWGMMPGETQTTARSGLLKRAALGYSDAYLQVGTFFVASVITIYSFHSIINDSANSPDNPAWIGIAACVASAIAASAASCRFHLWTWTPRERIALRKRIKASTHFNKSFIIVTSLIVIGYFMLVGWLAFSGRWHFPTKAQIPAKDSTGASNARR